MANKSSVENIVGESHYEYEPLSRMQNHKKKAEFGMAKSDDDDHGSPAAPDNVC